MRLLLVVMVHLVSDCINLVSKTSGAEHRLLKRNYGQFYP